ncbi:hypothetical protein QAD02_004910 [Eretmocerus hayati]|uniref:Uncharacterized protein n=1 Tax=Eretmocerus hayati TaxID=131215 RepID=A0ACC2NRZ6_9HYME|nr:hypothetical protein QAD02_004910 [Eretmocerus hayati]
MDPGENINIGAWPSCKKQEGLLDCKVEQWEQCDYQCRSAVDGLVEAQQNPLQVGNSTLQIHNTTSHTSRHTPKAEPHSEPTTITPHPRPHQTPDAPSSSIGGAKYLGDEDEK